MMESLSSFKVHRVYNGIVELHEMTDRLDTGHHDQSVFNFDESTAHKS